MLIESFHFGPPGRRRYASLHRPQARLVRSTGIVLCHPFGHEYFRAYRAYVRLADQLAKCGFPVMRFDYLGTGDSEGDITQIELEDCLADIRAAVEQLRKAENTTGIVLGGMRLGATLSLLAAESIPAVTALLLWDPVANGEHHVRELATLHRYLLTDLERFARPRRLSECLDTELVGMDYGRCMLRDIRRIALKQKDVARVLLVAGTERNPAGDLFSAGTVTEPIQRGDDYGWNDPRRIEEIIVDPVATRGVVDSLARTAA